MKLLTLSVVVVLSALPGLAQESDPPAKVSFVDEVAPILRDKCSHCHNRKTLPDRPSFESAKLAFVNTKEGLPVIVPGEPEKSLLLVALESDPMHEKSMPMVGERPTEAELETLRRWISEGAEWPKGIAGRIKPPFHAKE